MRARSKEGERPMWHWGGPRGAKAESWRGRGFRARVLAAVSTVILIAGSAGTLTPQVHAASQPIAPEDSPPPALLDTGGPVAPIPYRNPPDSGGATASEARSDP